MEALTHNESVALELRTAFRQVLISAKDVPLTDGYKRSLRHESHNLNVTEGALVVFATFNFADNYSPLLFQLVRGQWNTLAMTSCAISLTMLQTCHRSSRCIS